MASNHIKNVAIIGAGGSVGSEMTSALLNTGKFNITAISRPDSNATFPNGVKVERPDYTSVPALASALKGIDFLIITMNFRADKSQELNFIEAAAKAGVPWVMPNEYGSDGANAELAAFLPPVREKQVARDAIEKHGVSSWVAPITNPWLDYSLARKLYGIDMFDKKITLLDEGATRFNTTTLPHVGRSVATLLSLPIKKEGSSGPCLEDFRNKLVYFRSFTATQAELFTAAKKTTGTTDADWEITRMSADAYIKEGQEEMAKGNFFALANLIYGSAMKKGLGNEYFGRTLFADQVGGIKEPETVEGVVERVYKGGPQSY